ncbi:phosphoethanolamine--lipid A transferase [Luteibacter pinisoli]|uniref:Phosphoethanolamine--lipid A transferase n=1 Tax=Luteibacter pinisoli TaxID=2589080 RepID=A0A4Y5Z4W0_9GAMM|nr:phosphoethanolamine--lipid A transferase [Luteibacter pinisoli]QDE40197.1 phosphoethanolamine--lipid A transferase [Luteibacter pinisoli]
MIIQDYAAARRFKRGIPAWLLGALVAVYILAVLNRSLWSEFHAALGASKGMAGFWVLSAAVTCRLIGNLVLTLALVTWPRIGKALLAILILVSAASAYYTQTFGVRLNEEIIQSIFETTRAEAMGLITTDSVTWIGLFGILPAVLVLIAPVRFRPLWASLRLRAAIVVGAAILLLVPPLFAGRAYVYFERNHRGMYDVYHPYAALSGTFHYLQRDVFRKKKTMTPIGTDATLAPNAALAARKRVVVLVVGETARAENQSLQGYARETNPEMKRAGAIYFSDAWSCGTATTVSVPCMFSDMTREKFVKAVAKAHWNALDVLQHAGVDVYWRDNDEGCKDVCARVPNDDLTDAKIAGLCDASGCVDEVLVADLPQRLAQMKSPALLVLHIKGSHGPAYFQRYPAAFNVFKPGCDTAEVQTCMYDQTVASYDNTILYTDHILGRVVDALKADPEVDSAMMYLSDHGESLGEKDVYLHGADWATAPTQQKHIPMLMWLSPGWIRDSGLRLDCMAQRRTQAASQDNVFHTLLGFFDTRTTVYKPELDLLSGCRG